MAGNLPAIRAMQGTVTVTSEKILGIPMGPISPQGIVAYSKCTGPVGSPSVYSDWPITPYDTRQLQAMCHTSLTIQQPPG